MKLSTEQWVKIARTILIAALTIAGILGYDVAVIQPRELIVQEDTLAAIRAQPIAGGVSHFTEIEADTLKAAAPTAIGTATPALMADSLGVSNLFEIRDAATPVFTVADGGNVTLTGNQTLDALLLHSSTEITPTAGQIITPTTTFYSISASGAVSMTLGGSCTDGQVVFLYGDDAQTITVNDTNIRTSDGSAETFGQYDLVQWICDDNDWILVSISANS